MRPEAGSWIVEGLARGSTGSFFAVVLGLTGVAQLPAVLAHLGVLSSPVESWMGLALVGVFAPLIGAVWMTRREGEGRAFLRSFVAPPSSLAWFMVALFGFGGIHAAGTAIYLAVGGEAHVAWWYPPQTAQHVAALLMVPLAEEPGWRGFALPRLAARRGLLPAALVLGVVWALWHTCMFVLQGFQPVIFGLGMVNILAGSVVFAWLYRRAGDNLPVAIVGHAGAHLCNPTHALPGDATPFVVYTVALCATAGALVAFDRRTWA